MLKQIAEMKRRGLLQNYGRKDKPSPRLKAFALKAWVDTELGWGNFRSHSGVSDDALLICREMGWDPDCWGFVLKYAPTETEAERRSK